MKNDQPLTHIHQCGFSFAELPLVGSEARRALTESERQQQEANKQKRIQEKSNRLRRFFSGMIE
jgi:hypothetical protein